MHAGKRNVSVYVVAHDTLLDVVPHEMVFWTERTYPQLRDRDTLRPLELMDSCLSLLTRSIGRQLPAAHAHSEAA